MPSNANTGSVGQTAARQDAGAPRWQAAGPDEEPATGATGTLGSDAAAPLGACAPRKEGRQERSWNFGDPVADCYVDVATDSQALRPRIRKAARSHASGPPVSGEGREPEQPGQTNKQYDRKRCKRDSAVLRLICACCSDPLSFSRRPNSLC